MAEELEEEERESGKVMALIEKATNSTEPEVDRRLLKAIKMVVRYSDYELKLAAETLINLMKKQHSQVFCSFAFQFHIMLISCTSIAICGLSLNLWFFLFIFYFFINAD